MKAEKAKEKAQERAGMKRTVILRKDNTNAQNERECCEIGTNK